MTDNFFHPNNIQLLHFLPFLGVMVYFEQAMCYVLKTCYVAGIICGAKSVIVTVASYYVHSIMNLGAISKEHEANVFLVWYEKYDWFLGITFMN